MGRTQGRADRPGARGWGAVLLVLAALAAPPPARAFPIRNVGRPLPMRYDPFEAYFARALQMHRLHVQVPRGIHLTAFGGRLPNTAFVDYLRWRRSLAPFRFDYYHPWLGRVLALDARMRLVPLYPPPPLPAASTIVDPPATVFNPPPTPTAPPLVPTPSGPAPLTPEPQTVPEPASWAVALVLIPAAARLRRRRR